MEANALLMSFVEFNRGSDDMAHERWEKRMTKEVESYLH